MEPVMVAPMTAPPASAVAELAWEPLGGIDGVRNKVLWRDPDSTAGLLRIDAGRRLGAHTHRLNHHHV